MIILKKRAISLFLLIAFMFTCITGRLFSLTVMPKKVSSATGSRVRTLSSSRKPIYDRNLTPLNNDSYSYFAIIKPTPESLKLLNKINEDKSTLKTVIKGQLTVKSTKNNLIYSGCEDIKTLKVYDRYNNNSLVHILGYTDTSGNGVTGIEKHYNDYLKDGGELSISYTSDAQGRLLLDEKIEIRDNGYYSPAGLVLTIDKNIQSTLETALKNHNITKGAGVVIDNKSGEILGCASTPMYDRNNIAASLNDENAPFINRAFSQYPVGSVFKVITASACLENNISLKKYNCTGNIKKTENIFYCNKLDGHGEIDFSTALSNSCNTYFIEAGIKAGGKKLLNTAKDFHLGESTDFGNGYMTDKGTLPSLNDLKFEADIANFSFGQGKLTATPLQIASIFATLGNGGIYNSPTLIKGVINNDGVFTETDKKVTKRILKTSTCQTINNALKLTVIDGTGKSAYSEKFDSCSKTATAQSGQYDRNGNEIKYCWFVGFFPADEPKYTVCIMKENGISGGQDCGPVFKDVAERIVDTGAQVDK